LLVLPSIDAIMIISDAMRDSFGLAAGATVEDLIQNLDARDDDVLDGILQSEESRQTALSTVADFSLYTLELVPQIGRQTRYCSIVKPGETQPILVGLFGDFQTDGIATDLENLLFWMILEPRLPQHNTWIEKEGVQVLDWRSRVEGYAIVAYPNTIVNSHAIRRMVAALFALEHPDLPVARLQTSVAATATKLLVDLDARGGNVTQARLMFEAVMELNPKWRCLSLYRIVEHAYLSNIKRIFNDEFERDAKAAVDRAAKSVSSELMQLVTLTETVNLRAEFVAFSAAIDQLLVQQNQFICNLDAAASNDPMYGAIERFKKGVLRFYKLRCSIAHGGTSSVIYEQFVDANAAAIALMPCIEAIAMKVMSIEIV
jgi:hypothetical protein